MEDESLLRLRKWVIWLKTTQEILNMNYEESA